MALLRALAVCGAHVESVVPAVVIRSEPVGRCTLRPYTRPASIAVHEREDPARSDLSEDL
jgi:hypothetical protein